VELNEEDDDDENIKKIQISNTSSYQPGYIVLEPDTEYTIVTAGYATYRGSCYIHFITECGVKVRAGKSLTRIWDKETLHVQGRLIGFLKHPLFYQHPCTNAAEIYSLSS
jgi:hypothetical protein